jgi:hypothetical protein
MTIRQPPPFAGRLLMRLVPAQNHDALLGDLSEEFHRRQSVVWYWAQILAAIIVSSWKDIRAHKLLAFRAIIVGFALQALAVYAIFWLRGVLTGGGFMLGHTWIGLPWYRHWPYTSRSLAAAFEVERIVGYMTVGWLLVRLHRGHGLAAVLAYRAVGFVVLPTELLLRATLSSHGLGPQYLFAWSLAMRNAFLDSALMIAGGYLATRRTDVHELA